MIILKNKDGLSPDVWQATTAVKLYELPQKTGKDIVDLKDMVKAKLLKLLEIEPWQYTLRLQKVHVHYKEKNKVELWPYEGKIPELRLVANDEVLRLGYTAAIKKVEKDLQNNDDKREETL